MPRGRVRQPHEGRVDRHAFIESPAEYLERVSGNWSAPDPRTAIFEKSDGPNNLSWVKKVTDEGNIISSSIAGRVHIYDKDKDKTFSFTSAKGVRPETAGEAIMKSGMLDYPIGEGQN